MNSIINFLAEKTLAQSNNAVNLLQPLEPGATNQSISSVKEYIQSAFPIFLGAAVALAIVMITWGGMEYMLSQIPGAKIEGKDRIKHALWGLILALIAWIILQTVNPQINSLGRFNSL